MTAPPRPADPAQLKACCAGADGSDVVALLLGESYHPGGLALTRRLARALALSPGQRVLDVAAGPGATAGLLAREFRVQVDGIDLSPAVVGRTRASAAGAGLSDKVRFQVGDAERIPLPAVLFDAVVCECALCTFPDKEAAAAEFARVLRPGGRVGITDVTVGAGGLPAALTGIAGWVACLADAKPAGDYSAILERAGLRTIRTETHAGALRAMLGRIHGRLVVLRALHPDQLADIDVDAVLRYVRLAADAVTTGAISYASSSVRKRASRRARTANADLPETYGDAHEAGIAAAAAPPATNGRRAGDLGADGSPPQSTPIGLTRTPRAAEYRLVSLSVDTSIDPIVVFSRSFVGSKWIRFAPLRTSFGAKRRRFADTRGANLIHISAVGGIPDQLCGNVDT